MVMIVFNWFPNNHFVDIWGVYRVQYFLDIDGTALSCSINESQFLPVDKPIEIGKNKLRLIPVDELPIDHITL